MEQLTFVLWVSIAILASWWPIVFSVSMVKLPLVNPISIMAAVAAPVNIFSIIVGPCFILDSCASSVGYLYALKMGALLSFCELLGATLIFMLLLAIFKYRKPAVIGSFNGHADLRRAQYVLLFLSCVVFVIMASREYGVVNWMKNPRTGYQLYREGVGFLYALALSFYSAAFVMGCLACRTPKHLLLIMFAYLAYGYFFGSKGVLLSTFIATGVFLWFMRWKYLMLSAVLGAPLMAGLLIYNLYLAISENFGVDVILKYFDYYVNAAMYYEGILDGSVRLFHGEVWLSSFWSYVPRALVSDKPYVYGTILVNEIFYPGMAAKSYTPAFGGAVAQYADFGLFGVILNGLMSPVALGMAVASFFMFRWPMYSRHGAYTVVAISVLLMYGPGFGDYFPALYQMILLVFIFIVMYVSRRNNVEILLGRKALA